jgi:hypothetical protein
VRSEINSRSARAAKTQTTDPQRDALLEAGVDDERLYEDRASGRRDDRPGLAEYLKSLRAGDTLVVWKLDRLGRDLHHLRAEEYGHPTSRTPLHAHPSHAVIRADGFENRHPAEKRSAASGERRDPM